MNTTNNPSFSTSRGFPLPFGPSRHPRGINFALFSKHATAVTLSLFEPGSDTPYTEFQLDPKINRTGHVWHTFVFDLPEDHLYSYRVDGPYAPFQGLYFDKRALLLDPYAKLTGNYARWGEVKSLKEQRLSRRGCVYPLAHFHWEEDKAPNIPLKELIIYEMHIRGFTQDPSGNTQHPGTFLGLIDKIPHLKSLGINAVELIPIFEFNENETERYNPKTKERLYNYWGYSTLNFFSPKRAYGTAEGNPILEFKTMVKALHEAGIEVILDVVYNHTAEGNQDGPCLSMKGLEAPTYYLLGPNGEYYNFSGCGNTLNCNNPVVREFIRDSLRFWVTEMHVDGFRFDLASILCRGHDGTPLQRPPIVEAISFDPVLANVKLIAEPWDLQLYQVGGFPAFKRWAEWNGKYRDTVRRFIKGTDNEAGQFATRLSGSEDLYGRGRFPYHSINFITCHDGFTLRDLVSYNGKHNEENGEDNRDGLNENESWNCGVEGEASDPNILALRERQMRNFHLALMVSQGIPMVLMGDEYGHTKLGNNNTWCHDSRLNWFQWDTLEKNQDFFRFYRLMIDFRKRHPILYRSHFLSSKDITWHGLKPEKPDWGPQSRFIAFTLNDPIDDYMLYVAFNVSTVQTTLKIPAPPEGTIWYRIVDTSLSPPGEFLEDERAMPFPSPEYTLAPFSSLILKTARF